MPITLLCPCGKKLRTADQNAGRRVRCPQCQSLLLVPEPDFVPWEEHAEEPASPVSPPMAAPSASSPPLRFGAPNASPAPSPLPFEPLNHEYNLEPSAAAPAPWLAPDPGQREPSAFQPIRGSEPSTSRVAAARTRPVAEVGTPSAREYLHWVLILALIPLALSLLSRKEDIKERLARSLQVPVEQVEAELEGVSPDELLARLPGQRIEGALLGHDTALHWIFAGMSASAFLGLLLMMFPRGDTRPLHLIAVGAFTATVGILFLLGVQFASAFAGGGRIWRGKAVIIWLILTFIRFSYQAALDDNYGFLASALGFTFGVGLCEELCKAIPFLWIYHHSSTPTWRQACLWGLASGVGFGVSEGIMYSQDHYNGMATGLTYLVRFISWVALHAIWGASVGLTLDRRQDTVRGVDGIAYYWAVLRIIAVPMVLHGMYDTMLKKDMELSALGVAVASFFWFAWLVESARGLETERPPRRAWS